MNRYLEHLAKSYNLHGTMATVNSDGWFHDYKQKDGRDLPPLAVLWDADFKAWIATFSVLSSGEYLHPHDAFAWLKAQVDDYEFPVCPRCDDAGIERWAVGDVEHSGFCDCWHGSRRAVLEEVRAE